MLEPLPSEIFLHINMTHTHQICQTHIHDGTVSPRPEDALLGWDRVTWGLIKQDSHQQVTGLRSPELCDMAHYPAESSNQTRVHCSLKRDGHGQQQYLGRLLHLNYVWLVLMGPKVGQAYIPDTIGPPLLAWTQTERLDWLRSYCLFQLLTLPESCQRNQDPSDQKAFFQSSVVSSQLEPQASVPNWQKWSSGLVLLKAICFKIWRVMQSQTPSVLALLTTITLSPRLSPSCLPQNQTGHSPLAKFPLFSPQPFSINWREPQVDPPNLASSIDLLHLSVWYLVWTSTCQTVRSHY